MIDWDERYGEADFAFGTEANAFLVESADQLPEGPVLCLAEGQGRNAVFLAGRGHRVVAVDQSAVGLRRASELAASRGVTIETSVADLSTFPIEPGQWSGIVSVFAHLPAVVRSPLNRRVVEGLRPGGVLILEAYSPRQIALGTGGPSDVGRLAGLDVLQQEFEGLEWVIAHEIERDVIEGRYHTGRAAVIQLIGRRPAA